MKSIAIHQPNYLPWLGFFAKLYLCDIFIIHDNVEFTKSGFTRRTHIRKAKHSSEKIFLTVPLKKASDFMLIKDLQIDGSQNWQKKQWQKIKNTYQKTPYFDQYFEWLQTQFASNNALFLAELNSALIVAFAKLIKAKCAFHYSAQLPITGERSAYNINLINHFNGATYWSGMGAKNYQSATSFIENNIELQYVDLFPFLEKHPYTQKQGNFLNGLSFIDALFNIGAEGIIEIFEQYKEERSLR